MAKRRNLTDAERTRLLAEHERLAFKQAARYHCPTIEQEDIERAAMIGLLHAIDYFEPERGLKFSTFAVVCIRGQILRLISSYRGQQLLVSGTTYWRMVRANELPHDPLSIHAHVPNQEDLSFEEAMTADVEPPDEQVIHADETWERLRVVRALLDSLPKRERVVICGRYLCDPQETYSRLGERLGVSKQAVVNIEARAMRRLREISRHSESSLI